MRKPGILIGAIIGALLVAPTIAILYLASAVAGLPFVAFDIFDWMARRLPGAVLTFGIDTMVAVIVRLGIGDISGAAKTAEQIMAIAGLVLISALAGAALFWWLRRGGRRSGVVYGAILGALLGIPVMLISLTINQTATAGPLASALWVLLVFLCWGAALGWSYNALAPAAVGPDAGDAPVAAVEPIDRRSFLVRLGGATAVVTVVGAAVGALAVRGRGTGAAAGTPWSRTNPLPNAGAAVEPVRGTRPELTPVEDHYRIDINTQPPVVQESSWRLRIGGLVDRPLELTLADLRTGYPPLHQFVTLACISNPIGGDLTSTTRWTGVSLQPILADAAVRPSATHLRIRSVDGFHEVVPIDAIAADERIMLTYAWDGLPLPTRHGFPLRIYIPDRYGMKQPKWIESIEAIADAEEGYWVRRGWDAVARMRATSVIDAVGVNMMVTQADNTMLIPIGGIAHAGARGISRVEIRVDDGEWRAARLREPLSDTTWVLWRFDWPFEAGEHTFTVRCFEGDGDTQIATRAPVRPSGATGLHSENVML